MATTNTLDELERLRNELRNDRLVEIYVGNQIEPYLVQGTVVAGISEIFSEAFKNKIEFGEERSVLRVPEDDQVAWEMLLHWRIRGFVSEKFSTSLHSNTANLEQLIRCWALGGKYGIKTFQNIIMDQTLDGLMTMFITPEIAKLAFELTPGKNTLRTLIAEELINLMDGDEEWDHFRLQELDGVAGFTTDLMCATDRKFAAEALGSFSCYGQPAARQSFMV